MKCLATLEKCRKNRHSWKDALSLLFMAFENTIDVVVNQGKKFAWPDLSFN